MHPTALEFPSTREDSLHSVAVLGSIQIPLLQLEPTARDTSESTGRVLRPNAHTELQKVTREEFAAQLKDITDTSLFVPAANKRIRALSAPPEYLFLAGVNERLPSPITPSTKESKDESFDDFASIDNPRANLPGAYHSTPKADQKKRVKDLTIDTLNKPSEPACIASSSTTQTAHVARHDTAVKQEGIYPKLPEVAPSDPLPPFIPPHIPAQAHTHQQTTRARKPSASAQATTNPKPLPTIPALQPRIMSAIPYRMPIRGTDRAPKFDGKTAQLRDFLETYDQHADDANLQGLDRITQLLRYLSSDDRELWSGLPQAKLSDYDAFIREVREMYPGWEGDR
ncbi:hypothetical protein CY34DRAFT_18163 [Suillus luteus UH-Slu-Lm8-n1]|uniref:Uncharacterized protein n=1 Tax=Suillus luteus UH-Slu-Lm8-n1 TaxID=930992 RepID=A0A0D0A6E2_9AGAM|nr:hypothetical protein CY34DRAFT_18163 [Suillus luteus UH-Slu-Lm8-n1]